MKAENKKAKKQKKKTLIWLLLPALVLAALLLDSNYRIVVTEYRLDYENLPQSFDGYRIVQLSDLHMADFGERLFRLVREEEPDIIVLTGDFLNMRLGSTTKNQTPALRPTLEELKKIAPCYFVSGNHEWASGETAELSVLMEELGIRWLRNEAVTLWQGDESIVLAGVEDPNAAAGMKRPDELAEELEAAYPGAYRLLLAHRNDFLVKYPALPVDTILCGHAHGGIVRLPFAGGLFGTGGNLFPKYEAGHYNEGGYDLIVSRGLGGFVPIPRFLNNPELVSISLKKSS